MNFMPDLRKRDDHSGCLRRKTFWAIFALAVANLSMTRDYPESLLADLDRQLETDQERPALSSGLRADPYWERFNKWQCFDNSTVSVQCVGHLLDPDNSEEETLIPSIRVELDGEAFDFDQEDARKGDCPLTLRKWAHLLEGEKYVCVYAAYLQEIDKNNSYWILNQFKTSKGYWSSSSLPESEVYETFDPNESLPTRVYR